jgi:hypothetical protein
VAQAARCSGVEGNQPRNAGGVARAGEGDAMLGWDGEGHDKEMERWRPWGSEDAGGSELGPPAMAERPCSARASGKGEGGWERTARWSTQPEKRGGRTGCGGGAAAAQALLLGHSKRKAESEREKENGEGKGR